MNWPVSPDKLAAFLAISTAMSMTPGPAMLFATAAGMNRGRRGVAQATLGMSLAAMIWFIASAMGLLIVATTLPVIFKIAGAIGVVYIAWLGIGAMRGAFKRDAPPPKALKAPGTSTFRDGFIVQITNPKALLYFTAILPPFVAVDVPIIPQMSLFAATSMGIDASVMVLYGMLGAAFAHKMEEPRFRRAFSFCVGIILFVVAVMMAERL
jgi:threonine/homoserine/homoserine lactone efflux protein